MANKRATKPAAKSGKRGPSESRTFDDAELIELLDRGEVAFSVDWKNLRRTNGDYPTTYGSIAVCAQNKDGTLGNPVRCYVRTAYARISAMTGPDGQYYKASAPVFNVMEGRGRAMQAEGADTQIYDSQIRNRIFEFIKDQVANNPDAAAYIAPDKVKAPWVRTHTAGPPREKIEEGPMLSMVATRFTEFLDGVNIIEDPESGTMILPKLMLNGAPVQLDTLYRALSQGNTMVTVIWQPMFTITGSQGLCLRAEVSQLVVFPGTGHVRPPPTAANVLGARVGVDLEQLKALRQQGSGKGIVMAEPAPPAGGFDEGGEGGAGSGESTDGDGTGEDTDSGGEDVADPPVDQKKAAATRKILAAAKTLQGGKRKGK